MIKHFITHKRNENDDAIQDSMAFDVSQGRYAISDGVTLSFIPQIWSKTLVNYYVSKSGGKLNVTEDLLNEFAKARKQYFQSLSEDELFLVGLVEEELSVAKATFAGVQINNHVISWQVIGDSCIFIIPADGPMKCISSVTSIVDSEGHIRMSFNNETDGIYSDGTMAGRFIDGTDSLDSGWIALMTDAVSDWFVKQYNQGNNPIDILLKLESNDDFEELIEKECRMGRMKSDDSCVILINIPPDKGDVLKEEKNHILNIAVDYFEEWYEQTLPLWMI